MKNLGIKCDCGWTGDTMDLAYRQDVGYNVCPSCGGANTWYHEPPQEKEKKRPDVVLAVMVVALAALVWSVVMLNVRVNKRLDDLCATVKQMTIK